MKKYRGKRSLDKILLKLKLKLDSSLDSVSAEGIPKHASQSANSDSQPSLPLPSENNPRYAPTRNQTLVASTSSRKNS